MSEQPSNPLTYYRDHRAEIDVLADEPSLFLLGLLDRMGGMTYMELCKHSGLPVEEVISICRRLIDASYATYLSGNSADNLRLRASIKARLELKRIGQLEEVPARQTSEPMDVTAAEPQQFDPGPESPGRMRRAPRSKKAILFVDDHQLVAKLSCEILEMQGYYVVSANSGEEALERFRQEEFDLVVTDYHMQKMNGLTLAQLLRSIDPRIPVIIVTGDDSPDIRDHAFPLLRKTDLFPALLAKIKSLFPEEPEQPRRSMAR